MKSNKTCTFKVVCCSVTILSLITIAAICLGVGSYGIIYANRNRMRFQSNNGYTEPLSTTLSDIVSTSLGVLTTSTSSNLETTVNEEITSETNTDSFNNSTVFTTTTTTSTSSANASPDITTATEQQITIKTSTVQEITNKSSSSSILTTIAIEPATNNNNNISTIEPLQNCIVNDEFHPEGSPTREGWIPICEGDDGCTFSGPNNNCICPENFCE